jgi:hypothetical protein
MGGWYSVVSVDRLNSGKGLELGLQLKAEGRRQKNEKNAFCQILSVFYKVYTHSLLRCYPWPTHREAAWRLHPKPISQAWERGFEETGCVVSIWRIALTITINVAQGPAPGGLPETGRS